MGEKSETDHRRHEHSPRKRRNGGTPVGYSGQIALRMKQCSVYSRCWVAASRRATKQYSLLGNRFLINKYTRPLLGNTFVNKHVTMEMIGATI
jgi:hypothetical protein